MDLSRLPEPLRSKLEKQLAALPAEYRHTLESKLAQVPTDKLEQVLSKTAPVLERMAGKQAKSSAGRASNSKPASSSPSQTIQGYEAPVSRTYDPHDHYNNTIQRGDRPLPPMLVIVTVLLALVVMAYSAGAFDEDQAATESAPESSELK